MLSVEYLGWLMNICGSIRLNYSILDIIIWKLDTFMVFLSYLTCWFIEESMSVECLFDNG